MRRHDVLRRTSAVILVSYNFDASVARTLDVIDHESHRSSEQDLLWSSRFSMIAYVITSATQEQRLFAR